MHENLRKYLTSRAKSGQSFALRPCSTPLSDDAVKVFSDLINAVKDKPYGLDLNQIFDKREFLDDVDEEAKPTYFCSEYAAICLKKLKILPERLNTSRIVPGKTYLCQVFYLLYNMS